MNSSSYRKRLQLTLIASYRPRKMLNLAQDIEYMNPYPAGYVRNQLRAHIADLPVGISIQFAPEDYDGIPMRHFYNALNSTLASEYGNDNIRTSLQQQHGIIKAIRLR